MVLLSAFRTSCLGVGGRGAFKPQNALLLLSDPLSVHTYHVQYVKKFRTDSYLCVHLKRILLVDAVLIERKIFFCVMLWKDSSSIRSLR